VAQVHMGSLVLIKRHLDPNPLFIIRFVWLQTIHLLEISEEEFDTIASAFSMPELISDGSTTGTTSSTTVHFSIIPIQC